MIDHERNTAILEMVRSGKSYGEVAATLGVTVGVVAGVFSRWSETPAPKKPKPPSAAEILSGIDTASLTIPEIATAAGMSYHWARKWVWRLKLPFKHRPQGAAAPAYARNGQMVGLASKRIERAPIAPARTLTGYAAVPADPHPMGCRYILGEPGEPEHRYCGARREAAGRPYCPAHQRATHVAGSAPDVARHHDEQSSDRRAG